MKKVTLIKTDDPENPKLTVTVTGPVEKVVKIEPKSVYLQGVPGDTLEAIIKITPLGKYNFSILSLEQKENTNIKATLIAPTGGEKFWWVKVKMTSDKAGHVYDLLTLKTDSKYLPSIAIRAYAMFVEKAKTD
jgi:hypothetical protein